MSSDSAANDIDSLWVAIRLYKDCVEAVGTLDSMSLTEDQLDWARSLKNQFMRDH